MGVEVAGVPVSTDKAPAGSTVAVVTGSASSAPDTSTNSAATQPRTPVAVTASSQVLSGERPTIVSGVRGRRRAMTACAASGPARTLRPTPLSATWAGTEGVGVSVGVVSIVGVRLASTTAGGAVGEATGVSAVAVTTTVGE